MIRTEATAGVRNLCGSVGRNVCVSGVVNELAVDARSTALDIGSDGYDGNLSVQMTFERLVPYAAIGWCAKSLREV